MTRLLSIPGRRIEVEFHVAETGRFTDFPKWRGGHVAYARLALQDILVDEECLIYSFLHSSIGFFLVYGFAAIFNRKVFRKRLHAIRPSRRIQV